MQIGKQVPELAWILDAQERHLVTGNESLRIGQVLAERVVVPGDIGILHRWRVSIAGHAAGLAPNDAMQAGTNEVLSGLETMADLALIEYCAPRCASPRPWACATRANGSSAAVPLNMLDSFMTPLPPCEAPASARAPRLAYHAGGTRRPNSMVLLRNNIRHRPY